VVVTQAALHSLSQALQLALLSIIQQMELLHL
jgi:hypothetical protein